MSIKKHLISIFPLLLIPLILILVWFRNGLILGGGDESFIFYNPKISFERVNNTWQEYQTGYPFLVWLSRANFVFTIFLIQNIFLIPTFYLQAISFYILMVVGVISVYFLISFLLNNYKTSYSISLIAALFYLFNPFSVSQVWGRGLYAQYFAFALLPLSLLLFALGLKKRNFIFSLLLAFASFFFSTAFGFVTFIPVLWGILFLYLIYWIFQHRKEKKDLIFGSTFFATAFIIWCFVSAWWLSPLVFSGNAILAGYIENPSENLGTLLGVSRNFTPEIITRLLQRTYYYDSGAFSPVYRSFLFQLISLFPLIFLIIGSIKIFKSRSLKNFRFLFMILVLGLIVSLGANPPLGWLFILIFKQVSFLQSFRNPFEKFGLVYSLGYSAIFAFGLINSFTNNKLKNWLILFFLIMIFGIFAWPMWSGKVVSFPNKSPGIDVPQHYSQLNNWLNFHNEGGYRVFMTPVWSGDGAFYQWNNTNYNGIDPMIFLLNTAVITASPPIPYYYDFIQNLRKYAQRINLAPALGLLRVGYVVNRNDAIVEDKEKQHKIFLTEAIFPPAGGTENFLCQTFARIVCPIPSEKNNWSKVRYIHAKIKTNIPSFIELALMDQNLTRIRWDGRSLTGIEYQTSGNEWVTLTFPLNAPTEYNSKIDFSKVLMIELSAYPVNPSEGSISEILLEGLYLDAGLEEKTNSFSLVNTFGNLEIYKTNVLNVSSEFGVLREISIVLDFPMLFTEVSKSGSLKEKGFLLEFQNKQSFSTNKPKDLNNLLLNADIKIKDKYKFSDTKYWLEVDESNQEGWLILSKTFNTEWKVIPGVNKKMLEGNLFNNLNLLKMKVLSEENHFVGNGYANFWKINDSDREYAIVFMPQIIAEIGLIVSIFSIMLLAGLTLWQGKKYLSSH